MLLKLLGVLLVIVGIAGLILPILPGILLIAIGSLLFFNNRLGEIRKMLPEKIPTVAAILYNKFIPKILAPSYSIIADKVRLIDGQTLLDIGTGPGILPIMIAERNPSVKIIGIDLSEKMIELANRNKLKAHSPQPTALNNLEFKVMAGRALDFPDNSLDVVISTGSLHHWKDPVKIFDEIYRCLKPGGEAWVCDGYADGAKHPIARYILNIHGYTKREYDTLVKGMVRVSRFKDCIFADSGMMMLIRLKK